MRRFLQDTGDTGVARWRWWLVIAGLSAAILGATALGLQRGQEVVIKRAPDACPTVRAFEDCVSTMIASSGTVVTHLLCVETVLAGDKLYLCDIHVGGDPLMGAAPACFDVTYTKSKRGFPLVRASGQRQTCG